MPFADLQNLPATLQSKLDRLYQELVCLQPGILAFSGGVDSRFLAFLADSWQLDYKLIFFSGAHNSQAAEQWAFQVLSSLDLPWELRHQDPLQHPQVAANTRQRCFYCKQQLFGTLTAQSRAEKLQVLEGSQLSDLSSYRPGKLALEELGVASPYLTAGLDKSDIRLAGRILGLPYPEQASRPCLLTRFAYGLSPQLEQLTQLGRAEDRLQELGFSRFRLRIQAKNQFCLQIHEQERELWLQNVQAVQRILAAEGFKSSDIIFSHSISGFFDTETKQDTGQI